MIYYSEFHNREKSIEERLMQRLIGNFELFDRYRKAIGDERFFSTVRALADEYKWDCDDIEEFTRARVGVARRFGRLFDASLIEDLLFYYDDCIDNGEMPLL